MEKDYDFLIVGSGLAGATFAHLATEAGKSCVVAEKRTHIGGNIHQQTICGIPCHVYGAHIFRTDSKEIWDFVNQFVDFNNFINSPIANYRGKLYNLPFNMNTFYQLWGVRTPEEAKAYIQGNSIPCDKPENLKEHVLSLVGWDIYKILIKEYTEKQWGKPIEELSPDIMRRIPLRFTFDNNYYRERYQGVPIQGFDTLIEKLLQGCDIKLNCNGKDLIKEGVARQIIYTGPLDELFDYRFGALEWRGLFFEHEEIEKENYQGVAVMNFTDDTPYTRIIEHKHFLFGKVGGDKTVITKEYPSTWHKGDEPFYPVNDEYNNRLQVQYEKLARAQHIVPLGRLGKYRYFDMAETIADAMETASETIL